MFEREKSIPIATLIISIIATLFIGYSFIVGCSITLLFGIILIITTIVGNVLDDGTDYNHNSNWKRKFAIMSIPLLLMGGTFIMYSQCQIYTGATTKNFDIYNATVPYGIIWREERGSMVFLSGHFDTSLEESYIVKYMNGSSLYTMNFIANETYLIVDKTFVLEEKITTTYSNHWLWGVQPWYSTTKYFIHIPELPPLNGTTEYYITLP